MVDTLLYNHPFVNCFSPQQRQSHAMVQAKETFCCWNACESQHCVLMPMFVSQGCCGEALRHTVRSAFETRAWLRLTGSELRYLAGISAEFDLSVFLSFCVQRVSLCYICTCCLLLYLISHIVVLWYLSLKSRKLVQPSRCTASCSLSVYSFQQYVGLGTSAESMILHWFVLQLLTPSNRLMPEISKFAATCSVHASAHQELNRKTRRWLDGQAREVFGLDAGF